MFIVTIDIEKCKACGDCVEAGPVQGIVLQAEDGKQVAVFTAAPDECLGCMACQEGCPEGAVTVTEL
jgi:NAD-dependent dihydropyrimidine dehydrogenase PreA subunit